MIKEELDKLTLDSVETALKEVGFDVRRMENCVVIEDGHELYTITRSFHHAPSAQTTLELFKESMRQSYWNRGVGRIYLYRMGHHIVSEGDYRATIRYALHLDLGTREGFKSELT